MIARKAKAPPPICQHVVGEAAGRLILCGALARVGRVPVRNPGDQYCKKHAPRLFMPDGPRENGITEWFFVK